MISLIVAMDRNGLISFNQKMPWHRSEDLKNFSRLTRGNTVVMGRTTYESIGRALLERTNIVLSKNRNGISTDKYGNYINYYSSVDDYLYSSYYPSCLQQIFIIGGMQVYKAFAPYVERMYLTVVNQSTVIPDRDFEAVYFPWPSFAGSSWRCTKQHMLGPDYFYVYDKVNNYGNTSAKEG